MPDATGLTYRDAGPGDVPAIARLHAESWRRHYRGAYSDAFLDGDVSAFLLTMWTERFAGPGPRTRTIVADLDGQLAGIAHTVLGKDGTWGSLLDNLHVTPGLKRHGIGSRLLALTRAAVTDWSAQSPLYLWVLEQNAAARAFYEAMGGTRVERRDVPAPGGDPANLAGRPACLRYVWRAALPGHGRRRAGALLAGGADAGAQQPAPLSCPG